MTVAALLATLAIALPASLGGCRDRDPNTPIALISTPSGQGGEAVSILYVLRNPDTRSASISCIFSTDFGASYRAATRGVGGEGTENLQASPGGTSHTFVWNALADLGPGRHANVIFLIVPTLDGQQGQFAQTGTFTLDNTDIFVRSPDLALQRDQAAATPLPDGDVLVAGGGALSGVSEAFSPSLGDASTRASLSVPRDAAVMATALLGLGGGAFTAAPVIVGGRGLNGVTLSSVEVHDPALDAWTLSALDVAPRVGHAVTRLADGRILVSGGGPATDVVLDLRDGAAPTATATTGGVDRTGHTATLLLDGRVLVTGGRRAGVALADTLVLSPDNLAYTAGPALVTARSGHAAALVGDRPLVTGGLDASGTVTSSAEIADVTLTAFALTPGSLVEAREGHTATALGDGSVLLTGGDGGAGTALATAERFVPSLAIFVRTRAPMAVGRRGHQAVLTGAGRIVITGGGTDAVEEYLAQSLSGALVFDPIATAGGGRVEHQVTALADGRALVTGGTDGLLSSGTPTALASAEIFDPAARADQRLTPVPSALAVGRRGHAATLLADGTVLISGGIDTGGASLASLERFTPSGATFGALAETLPAGLSEHTSTRLADGRVLLAGGRLSGGGAAGAAYIFDPLASGARLTTVTASLAVARRRHSATLLGDGRVLLAGGLDGAGQALAAAEIFEPVGASFTATAADLGVARFGHEALRLLDGTTVVLGGRGGTEAAPASPTGDVRRFDPATTTFTALAPLLTPRAEFAAIAASSGRVVVAGGVVGTAAPGSPDLAAPVTGLSETYTPTGAGSSALTSDPTLSVRRRGIGVARLTSGQALLYGGRREDLVVVPGGERLLP